MMMPSAPGPSDVTQAGLRPSYVGVPAVPQPDLSTYIQNIANSGPEAIKLFSTRLRQTPYYRGKPVNKLTPGLLQAIQSMEEARVSLRNYRGDIDRSIFLLESVQEGLGDEGRGPGKTVQRRISTKLEAEAVIDEIYKDLLGRSATKTEKEKYRAMIVKREKAKPVVTTYSGGDVNQVTQTGGPDIQEFLYKKIAGTDEAKQQKVFGFYEAFKKALGV